MSKAETLNQIATNLGLHSTVKKSSYYVIKHGNGTFLGDVWEDQNTEEHGGNYEFNASLKNALRLKKYNGTIELPKYLHYHTDGTHIDNLAHFLRLINGQVLAVDREDVQAIVFSLTEVCVVEVPK